MTRSRCRSRESRAGLRPWAPAASCRAAVRATWVIARQSTRDLTRGLLRRCQRARRRATTASCCSATCSCWASRAAPASPASSPAPRCPSGRGQLRRLELGPRQAGPLAIGFVDAATPSRSRTQAYALGGDASTLAAQLGISPADAARRALPARGARAVRALPPARRVDDGQPPRRWEELLAATFVTVALAVPTSGAAPSRSR